MLRAYMYKLLRSPLMWLGIFGSASLMVFAMCCSSAMPAKDVEMRLGLFLDVDVYRKIIAVFAALPFAANFADEWNNGVTNQLITRVGVKKYAVTNAAICFVTSFLAVFAGIMIFLIGYSFFYPVYSEGNERAWPYAELLSSGLPWIYIILRTFFFSLNCAVWSMMGLMLSAFFPNKYVAICSPLIACYAVERITIQFPDIFNLWYLSLSINTIGNSVFTFIYTFFIFAALSAVFAAVFVITVKRRTGNEMV